MQEINWFITWGPSSRRRAQITILEPTKAAHSIDKLHTLHRVQSIRKHNIYRVLHRSDFCIFMITAHYQQQWWPYWTPSFLEMLTKKVIDGFFFFVTQLKVLVPTFYHSNNSGCCFYSLSGWVKGRDPIPQRGSVLLFWSFEYVSVLPKNNHGCIMISFY